MNQFNYAVEIGAGDSYSSILLKNSNKFSQILLIEPNKLLFDNLEKYILKNNLPITIQNIAISNSNEEKIFFNFGYCSFLKDQRSFLKLSCEENAEYHWRSRTSLCQSLNFAEIDNGKIDYLILTANGAELDVLMNMKSRPQIIKTKYYCHNSEHWSYYNSITDWMHKNMYHANILYTSEYNTYYEIDFIKL